MSWQFPESQLLFGLVNTRWHILYTHLTSVMDTRKRVRFFALLLVSCCPPRKESYWYCVTGVLLGTRKPV